MLRFAVFLLSRINEEFRDVKLADLRILATLGVGGFGRVELVQIAGDPTRSFALKQMKKSQVWSRKVVVATTAECLAVS
jgi:cGMP-dependent protein kinase